MSTLTVQNLTGVSPTNLIRVASGHKLYAPGGIVQVQQTIKTDSWTGSVASGSATYATVTGLSVGITPTSSSSKILVMLNMWVGYNIYMYRGVVRRNGTHIAIGDANGNRPRVSFGGGNHTGSATNDQYHMMQVAFNYLDSPATTSTLTYDVGLASYSGYAVYVNRSHAWQNSTEYDPAQSSTITVMEVAQ